MVRMVLPVGTEMAVNHLVVLHHHLVAQGRQAIPVTPLEALVRPEVLPEVAVMAMAMATIMEMGNERVRTRRNQMVKVLKVKRKKLNQRWISMLIASDGHVVIAHLETPMTRMMGIPTSQIPMIRFRPHDGSGCSVRGETTIAIWH